MFSRFAYNLRGQLIYFFSFFSTGSLFLVLLALSSSRAEESPSSVTPAIVDVQEGQNVRLDCRFSPDLAKKASTLYWIRTNRNGHDNVAIGNTPFQAKYR